MTQPSDESRQIGAAKKPLDLARIRERLARKQGPAYWRSLEELAESEEFKQRLEQEFPSAAFFMNHAFSRRDLLKAAGTMMALAGLTACRQPLEKIIPYVRAPEEIEPGKPLFFATAHTLRGVARGVLVESHMGRPTKMEGNPRHPDSLGAVDIFAQASLLDLYDPDRSQMVLQNGVLSSWNGFLFALRNELNAQRLKKGAGLRLLTETVTSPALAGQIRLLLQEFPEARWHQYEPFTRDNALAGARLAFGRPLNAVYRFDRADVIWSLDADFLQAMPGHLRYARDFASKRRVSGGIQGMNRLYSTESAPAVTGSMADHRLPVRAREMEDLARLAAGKLGVPSIVSRGNRFSTVQTKWIDVLARDLQSRRGRSLVLAGDAQPPAVHALAHAMNDVLGNADQTVYYTDPVEAEPVEQMASLQKLAEDMDAGAVETLLILGGNPVHTAPADLRFAERLAKVPFRAHLSLYDDETSASCQWHIPETHALEAWGDARAFDGSVTVLQPLIAPLYNGKSAYDVVLAMMKQPSVSGYDALRNFWKEKSPADFEARWKKTLHEGVMEGTAFTPLRVSLQNPPPEGSASAPSKDLEVTYHPDPTIFDGRFANNGWLQELPKPLLQLTWDNVARISPATAERLGLANGDVVEISRGEQTLKAPVWIAPGQPDDSVALTLGYGRTRSGRIGTGIGYNANFLRTSLAPWRDQGMQLRKTGKTHKLAGTQTHFNMQGHDLVRAAPLERYLREPDFAQKMSHEPSPEKTLYPPRVQSEDYAWGMAIDLNVCIGCKACVIACQSENNIPVVGKDQVLRGRELHWLRVDHYYRGGLENPETFHQPVPCMHCENAPCEPVCPVEATLHDKEGLNQMVYNRCVGTRYCSNNCPYKVRRFNFYKYADTKTPTMEMMRNPDVTVRGRGVMEKCTYCIQRISGARIEAEKEDRKIRDGEVTTACQAACPTEAIVFGNLKDPQSRVAQKKAQPLNYGILTHLNTQPRTTYLAKLENPNSEITGNSHAGDK